MEKKLRAYAERKFRAYPKTAEIIELREELYTMMRDKYEDGLKNGLSKEQSYKEALTILDDCKSAVREVETGSSLAALKKKLISCLAFSAFYFIALTCAYLYVSMIALESFETTWLIVVGGAFAYLIYFTVNMFEYAKLFGMRLFSRIALGTIFLSAVPILYILPNLCTEALYGSAVWEHTWLIIPVIVFFYIVTDLLVFGKSMSPVFFWLELPFAGLVLTTGIYLFVSYFYDAWNVAWIVYVAYLSIVALGLYISERIKTGGGKGKKL